ncbi:hypothetical protein GQ457_06G001910 [Hibiscus cannabinus]
MISLVSRNLLGGTPRLTASNFSKMKVISGDLSYLGPVENEGVVFVKLVAVKTSLEVFLEANWTGKEILIVQSNSQFQLVSSDMISMADSLAKLGIQRSETFKAWW